MKPDMERQPSEQSLLHEYTEANAAVLANAQRSWQAVSIFSGLSVVGLVVIARELIARDIEKHNWHLFFAVLTVGLISTLILAAWWLVYRRQLWLGEILYFRMREIEINLRLRRNIYVHTLDRWEERSQLPWWQALTPEERSTLERLAQDMGRPPRVKDAMRLLIFGASLGWAGMVIWEGLTVAGVGR